MFPTLSLQGIIAAWRDTLAGNNALRDFCQVHYGRDPKIVVGCKTAAAEDCPVVILRPGGKTEGTGKREFPWDIPQNSAYEYSPYNIYKVIVDWAAVNSAETTSGLVTEQAVLTEIDRMGQIIIAALGEASPANPVSRLEYGINPAWFPMLVGTMTLQTQIEPVLGAEMVY